MDNILRAHASAQENVAVESNEQAVQQQAASKSESANEKKKRTLRDMLAS
jgi:hypothetical protein